MAEKTQNTINNEAGGRPPREKRRSSVRNGHRNNVQGKGTPKPEPSRANAAGVADASVRTGKGRRRFGNKKPAAPLSPLRVFALGGLEEIGKNMYVIECGDDIVVVDGGMAFPDEDMLGVDAVIPDITYLMQNITRVRGILLTHGHEDHIGALPTLLKTLRVPVYGTALTLGILQNKLAEEHYEAAPTLRTVVPGDVVALGGMKAEFIHVNHSIPDACALAITTMQGVVFCTGDFKLDVSPIDGQMMDVTRIGQIGNAGVLLMLGESTNAERPGHTPSERIVGQSINAIFEGNKDKRIIIATFSSNVHRVQQIIEAAAKHHRKVAVLGRSMVNVVGAAVELGYITPPDGVLIDVSEMKRFKNHQICLITTGSQGEPMSALYRMAFGEHDRVKLSTNDLVVMSSSPIPGNEKLISKVTNALIKSGIKVVGDRTADVHVSGHACKEELKFMLALVRPKYLMPVHGESRHLFAHRELAEFMGIPANHIFLSENGKVLEIDRNGARFAGTVPSGKVLIDGSGVGDVGSVVLRDRRLLSQEGLIAVVAAVSPTDHTIVSGPEIITRGFVYQKESEEMMDTARQIAARSIERNLSRRRLDYNTMKTALRDDLQKYFYKQTKRRPVILAMILEA